MKAQLLAACFALSVLCATSTPVAAQTKTDITLEGPWILYTDTTLEAYPVLVAVSPGGLYDDTNDNSFHTPRVTAGDGYPVGQPAIYCMVWGDDGCAPARGKAPLTSDGYPSTVPPLSVNAVPTAGQRWDWASKVSSYQATIFILPMPDSYSTFAGWYMRFAGKWEHTGHTYQPLVGEPLSIGVELHYANGPKQFHLQTCVVTNQGKLGKCTDASGIPHNTDLNNIGTLSIAMKSPTNNACDPHVRMAYPKMIKLLDGDNTDHAVIDPAKGTDLSGYPQFDKDDDKYRCLDQYPQTADMINAAMRPMAENVLSWTDQLSQFGSLIGTYLEDPSKVPELKDPKLLLPQIKQAIDNLDKNFPRFSQVRLIDTVLRQSQSEANILNLELNPPRHTDQDKADSEWKALLHTPLTLLTLDLLEIHLVANPPTKSGNDCNAPLMLVR